MLYTLTFDDIQFLFYSSFCQTSFWMNCAFFRMNVNQILLFGSKEHHHVKRSNGMKCQNNIFVLTATSPITRTFNSSFIFLGCCRRTNYFVLRHLIVLKRRNIDLSNRLQEIYAEYWVLLLRWPLLRFLKCDRIFLLMSFLILHFHASYPFSRAYIAW